ncbi:diaminopimelate epimerase [Streptomyces sp. CA-250714]|uniref:diaminopimelate epimerase n=1 Tax=Streptomyces sp. CA-250714 TaxID=3240060 RepID=UPI003D8E8EA8
MTSASGVPFLKGHGTENDFVIIPDPDGLLDLSPQAVARLCDRRAGIGGDGVLRVVRSAAHPEAKPMAAEAEWFMDYRNSDGSVAEMCGNGARVFARYLERAGLAAPGDLAIATRAGVRKVHIAKNGGDIAIAMGTAQLTEPDHPTDGTGDRITVSVEGHTWPVRKVGMGNPHAVAFVSDLADAGRLLDPPEVRPAAAYPDGVNVEFVVSRGPRHVALRVHERGAGETRSCGTGACAVMVAAARRDGADPRRDGTPVTYTVDVPGGRLEITERADGEIEMTGPAEIVAEGNIEPGLLP